MENKVVGQSIGLEEKLKEIGKYPYKNVPTLLQIEAIECGAASLGMILRYYKLFIPLSQLRKDCGISRDGSKATYILSAAQSYGMDTAAYKKEPVELLDIELPYIVFWNFNHYVVVEGFGKKGVYLNDPAYGKRVVSYKEFDESFTGIVLTFKPNENFTPGGKEENHTSQLLERLDGSWSTIVLLLMLSIFSILPAIIIPLFSKIFIDSILSVRSMDLFGIFITGFILTHVLKISMQLCESYYGFYLSEKLTIDAVYSFFGHILKLPSDFFQKRYAGDIITRIGYNSNISQTVATQLVSIITNTLLVVLYGVFMLSYSIQLSIITFVFISANYVVLKLTRTEAVKRLSKEQSQLASIGINGIKAIETIKASGMENDFFSKWSGVQAKVVNSTQSISVMEVFYSSIQPIITTFKTAALLYFGVYLIVQGELSIGSFIAFQTIAGNFENPLMTLMNISNIFYSISGQINLVNDIFENETMKKSNTPLDNHTNKFLSGHVEIKNLTFGYNKREDPLIKDFNLNIKPGSRVALVGGSGSGKSTVSNIISGLFDPWSGEILFDGKNRDEYPAPIIACSIAKVDQNVLMFEGTIAENITLWDPTVQHESIKKAGIDACIDDAISGRANGYQSVISEGGRNFSGGQKQRIEIARALVNNPSVLILDEATSALDPVTEKKVNDAIKKRGCTCVIVAHRLSTIRDCDEIIVLDYGKVVERGTHEELISLQGKYANLVSE